MGKRIEFVDIAKCLCICLMVVGHSGMQGYPHDWIYAFHMPFFFLASGLFLKADTSPIADVIRKNCKQLLIPYVFFYILTIPFGLVYIYFHGEPLSTDYLWKPIVGMLYGIDHLTDTYSFFTNGPLWFLLAIFWARILFTLNRVHKYSTFGIVAGGILSFCLFLLLHEYKLNIWSIDQGLMLYPYLCIGYLLNRKLDMLQRINSSSDIRIIFLFGVLFSIVSASIPLVGACEYGSLRMGAMPWLAFPIAVAGSIMLLFMSKLLIGFNTKNILNIGGGTMVYLAVHHPAMGCFKFVLSKLGYDISGGNIAICIVVSMLTIIACYPCLQILGKYCPKFIGK